MKLQDKVAIVTGGGSGFGKEIALRFAREGARVVVVDISATNAALVAAEIGERAVAFGADVSSWSQVEGMVHCAEETFGGLDILVNNAGVANDFTSVVDTSEAEYDRMFEINTKGTFLGIKAAVPALRRRGGGVILNTASIGAVIPRPGHIIYAATKSAVITLTKGLVGELSPDIRINCVLPSASDTGFIRSVVKDPSRYSEIFNKAVSELPLQRACLPEDVANALVFLASDEASFITGVALPIDGGRASVS